MCIRDRYFYVTDGEVMRAFVHSIGNAKIKAVFDQTPDDAVAVSYTHLDVYKRQQQVLPVQRVQQVLLAPQVLQVLPVQ